MKRTPLIRGLVTGLAVVLAAAPAALAKSGNFLLIRRDMPVQTVEVAEIGARRLVFREDGGSWVSVSRGRCVALLNTDVLIVPRRQGWLDLADGQRFPGQALSAARMTDVLVWIQSSWLGRMEVPLDHIRSALFQSSAVVPPQGDADVLLLANGDLIEGFITSLGDPVSLELTDADTAAIDLPLGRVHAVRMVTPPQKPTGPRLWLLDGTIVEARQVLLSDDGFYRLEGVAFTQEDSYRIALDGVAALLFDPDALVPFADLTPRRVEGPPTRYVVPAPRALDDHAPLGLSRLEFRGPITVYYVLPAGAMYFAAEAQLPAPSRAWGDCELIIRDDDRTVFTARLNAETPTASIGVRLSGSTLTVEVTEGAAGPIHDHVVLFRSLILVEE